MSTAFLVLIALICAAPVIGLAGTIAQGVLGIAAAAGVALVAVTIRPGEVIHFRKMIGPVAIVALIPVAWMVVQVLPLPAGWGHPIWTSAESAFGAPVAARISADPAATVAALFRYAFAIAVIVLAAGVTVDRQRAEWTLIVLAGAATASAAFLLLLQPVGMILNEYSNEYSLPEDIVRNGVTALQSVAALGVVLTLASAIRVFERHETRHIRTTSSQFRRAFTACLAGFLVCWAALITGGSTEAMFAAGVGLALILLIVLIRRRGLVHWEVAVFSVSVATIAVMLVYFRAQSGDGPLAVRFATDQAVVPLTRSLIADTPAAGAGAGVFGHLLPIYRSLGDNVIDARAPTTAAQVVVELGWPALWVGVVMALWLIVMLWRGAINRGRDSFYPAAGAGCTAVLLVAAFCDPGLTYLSTIIIASAVVGLAVAQKVSRTARAQD